VRSLLTIFLSFAVFTGGWNSVFAAVAEQTESAEVQASGAIEKPVAETAQDVDQPSPPPSVMSQVPVIKSEAEPSESQVCPSVCIDNDAFGYFTAARELIRAERYDEALRLYRKVLTLNLDPVVHEHAELRLKKLTEVDHSGPAEGRYYGMFLGAEAGLALPIGGLTTLGILTDDPPPGEMFFLLSAAGTLGGSVVGKRLAESYRLTRAEGEFGLLLGNWAALATAFTWAILDRQGLVGSGVKSLWWLPLGIATMGTGGMFLGARTARHLALDRGSATLAWLGAFVGAGDALLIANAIGKPPEEYTPDLLIVGSLTGMALGTWWGRQKKFSANRARLLSLGSYLGMASFAAGASLLGNDDTRRISGATVMGSFAGIGLAYIATAGLERGGGTRVNNLRIGPPLVLRDHRGLQVHGPLLSWSW